MGTGARKVATAALLSAMFAVPAAAAAFDPSLEAKNFAKTGERMQYVTLTPEFQQRLTAQNAADSTDLAGIAAAEAPQGADARNFSGNVCFQRKQECAGDVRFYDWPEAGFGIRKPVLFTARSGATISGNVWATKAGPAKRPGIVITTGSIQAPETLYWGLAAVLAKHGYVVLTYDVQGQGRSDTFGEGADTAEGFPSQAGQPFFDGTEDALDFLLSKPGSPYAPRPSCTTGTSHAPKQARRVAAGLNANFNPLGDLVDTSRIGIAGHSLGAGAVSYVGQIDPRVDALIAWDNLQASSEMTVGSGNGAPGGAPPCVSAPSTRPDKPAMTKPALGISNDYGIVATPNTGDPDPEAKTGGFAKYKAAGIDSMELVIRGGTHFESSFIPGMTAPALGLATLRGTDLVAWYSTAWFDRYVKCGGADCRTDADRRLLTDRWRKDARGGQVDANADPNLYSFYERSRYDIGNGAAESTCDDMRAGCASMRPDGLPAGYDHVADAYTAPSGGGGGDGGGGGSTGPACALPQLGTDAKDTPATLVPSGSGDAIRGRGGDDRLRGLDGDDCLYGEAGNDRLAGDAGADKLKGGAGNDRLVGGEGKDSLGGGPGADRIKARDGAVDRIRCGPGRDRVVADKRDKRGRGC